MDEIRKLKLLKLNEILKEKEKRAIESLKLYNAVPGRVHKKQLKFHKSPKRNRWVFGGNRTGKSECGAVEVVWMALGVHPYRENKKDTFGWVAVIISLSDAHKSADKEFRCHWHPGHVLQLHIPNLTLQNNPRC